MFFATTFQLCSSWLYCVAVRGSTKTKPAFIGKWTQNTAAFGEPLGLLLEFIWSLQINAEGMGDAYKSHEYGKPR